MDALALDELLGAAAPQREETWRYSRNALRALTRQEFVAAGGDAPLPQALLAQFDWPETRGRRVVFVNGVLAPDHSDLREGTCTVAIDGGGRAVLQLRDAPAPLHVVLASVPGAAATRWQAASVLRLEQGSAGVIEHHVGASGADVFGVLESEFCAATGAELRVLAISDLPESVSLYCRQRVKVQAAGRYRSTHALAGGRLQRFELACELAAPDARCEQRGAFALRGREHVDVHLDVNHAARDTRSDVLWRGVADQRARGILRGAITVARGADGADAQLQTKNVLLSALAEIDAQPVLEIHADEVKASHGASVGELDARALFYLRSRGIDAASARNLLIAGFCREAFGAIGDETLRGRLDEWLGRHLALAEGGA